MTNETSQKTLPSITTVRGRGRPKGSKNKTPEQKQVQSVEVKIGGTQSRTHINLASKTEAQKFVPTTLSQIFGNDGTSKYGTLDENVYEAKLNKMNRNELFRYASKYAIPLNDNLTLLRKRLMSEFYKHATKYTLTKNSGRTFVRTPAKAEPVIPEKAQ